MTAQARHPGIASAPLVRDDAEVNARALSADEDRLLVAIADQHLDGSRLLALARQASVTSSCGCGCGSIGFRYVDHPASDRSVPTPFVVEGEVTDADGEVVGGLLLFLLSGRPHDLEVYAYGNESLPLPAPERVRWVNREE